MAHLVSSWSDGKILPEKYILPPGTRPGDQIVPTSNTLPVIDLSKAVGDDRSNISQQIIDATQQFGIFQVINHGVKTSLMDDALGVFEEFFQLPVEEKTKFCSVDRSQKCILYMSNVFYAKEEIHNWRDSLRLICTPLEESMDVWPHRPTRFREVAGEYVTNVSALGSTILDLICEGLGLEPKYFAKGLSQEQILAVNYIPPCPDPSLTLAARRHCDPGLITLLLPSDVPGLQILKDEEWIGIEPIPGAFVVNAGHQLQIVSNGKLKSVEHRVVTNKDKARTSAVFFIQPTKDCLVEPAKDIATAENTPMYKSFQYGEFIASFGTAYAGNKDKLLEAYMI